MTVSLWILSWLKFDLQPYLLCSVGMGASSTFLAVVCVLVVAAHVKNSNQAPLGFSERDGQEPTTPSTYWYESILHNGEASFMPSSYKPNYNVFRNVVTDFGADNTGNTDASAAIQNAINGMQSFTKTLWCFC